MNISNDQGTRSPGQFDPAFGAGGKVLLDFANGSRINQPGDMVLTPDGMILIAGTADVKESAGTKFGLTRLHPNGDTDASFGIDGVVTGVFKEGFEATGSSPMLLDDGHILVVGSHVVDRQFNIRYRALARFTRDGVPDTSFGNGGYVILDLPLFKDGKKLSKFHYPPIRRPDMGSAPGTGLVRMKAGGKIVLTDDYGPTAVTFRLNLDGTLDTSFNGIGYVALAFPGSDTALAKLLVHDESITGGGATGSSITRPLLVRYNDDGQLDTTLAGDGYLIVPAGQNESPTSQYLDIARRSDGRLVAAGNSYTSWVDMQCVLALYTMEGIADSEFNDGKALFFRIGSGSQLEKVEIMIDTGHIVTVGSTVGETSSIIIGRLDPSGKWDSTFGGGQGWVLMDMGSDLVIAHGLTLQRDGNILVSAKDYIHDNGFIIRIQG